MVHKFCNFNVLRHFHVVLGVYEAVAGEDGSEGRGAGVRRVDSRPNGRRGKKNIRKTRRSVNLICVICIADAP